MFYVAKERVGNKKLHAATGHANIPGQAEQLREMVPSQFECDGLYVSEASMPTAVHNKQALIQFGLYSDA